MVSYRVKGRIIKIEIVTHEGFSRFAEHGAFDVNLRLIDDDDSITVVQFYKREMASEKTQTIYHYTTYNKSDIEKIHIYTEEVD